jgi:hypothetical protein
MEPSIPLDIIIEIRLSYGSVVASYSLPLSNVGFSEFFVADSIEAWAYYSPDQALADPYQSYLITGDLVPGRLIKPEARITKKFARISGNVFWPPGASDYIEIPMFTKEVRIETELNGYMHIGERTRVDVFSGAPPTLTRWMTLNDFTYFSQWRTLSPLAWGLKMGILYYPLMVDQDFDLTLYFR